jgi:hypothetical protein
MNDSSDDGTEASGDRTLSGRPLSELRGDEYYRLTYHAVRDALLDVVGTLLLTIVALALVWIGGAAAVSPDAGGIGRGVGGVIAVLGIYLAATTLDVIPPLREWF